MLSLWTTTNAGFAGLGPLARRAAGLSSMTAAGQLSFILALPLLARLFTPTDFGVFTIYMSIVNIAGPMAGLKFESALYAAKSRDEARLTLALCLLTITAMTLMSAGLVLSAGGLSPHLLGEATPTIEMLAPLGIFMAGMWSASSAWAIREEALGALSTARFLQPALMTVLQLLAGFAQLPGTSLILAHLASHCIYALFLFTRTITRPDLAALRSMPWRSLAQQAQRCRKFPMYAMPAQVSSLLAANLPPVLLGSMFGTEIAGYCGMAYRIVSAPLSIIAVPLGHVFTSEASRGRQLSDIKALGRKIFLASLVFVAVPMLVLGWLATDLASLLLGPHWIATGQIAAAYTMFTAAQALTMPFAELTSIYQFQALRLATEAMSAMLAFFPLVLAMIWKWDVLSAVWGMSLGGAAGSLLGFGLICLAMQRKFGVKPRSVVHQGI